jgi:hypothetical protein
MNDDEIERKLRRFRIVEPPARLRAAIVDRGSDGLIPAAAWMPAAAALMAAMVLYWLSAYDREAVRVSVDRASVARAANVELVARILGGGPQSRSVADMLVLMDEPKGDTGR